MWLLVLGLELAPVSDCLEAGQDAGCLVGKLVENLSIQHMSEQKWNRGSYLSLWNGDQEHDPIRRGYKRKTTSYRHFVRSKWLLGNEPPKNLIATIADSDSGE